MMYADNDDYQGQGERENSSPWMILYSMILLSYVIIMIEMKIFLKNFS